MESGFFALILMGIILILGKVVRRRIKILQDLYLPSALVGGFLALLLGPEVLGRIVSLWSEDHRLSHGLFPSDVFDLWRSLPGLLITVVFACLFIGKTIPPIREIWSKAGPMVAHGQTMAWGQYVVGLTLVLLFLGPFFDVPPMAGALIEIGFEGGHGTAAGLADTFRQLGFESGADLAIGLATVGVVAGVILGTFLVNWGVRKGLIDPSAGAPMDDNLSEHDARELQQETVSPLSADPLAIHLAFVGIAIGVGWLILQGMVAIEAATWGAGENGLELLAHVPLFPIAMIGGVIVQLALMRIGYDANVDRQLINRVSGASLDVLIVAALATLSLDTLGHFLAPLIALAVAGILWNLFGFLVLAPRMFANDWFHKGLANFGQGIGMTVIGLLLIRMSDPYNRSGAIEAFGYKQLLFEPIVGGGLFTAASLPLIYNFGILPVLTGTTILMLGWLVFGLYAFGPKKG